MITPAYLFTCQQTDQLSLATGPGSGCADDPEKSYMHIERRHQHNINYIERKHQSPGVSHTSNMLQSSPHGAVNHRTAAVHQKKKNKKSIWLIG